MRLATGVLGLLLGFFIIFSFAGCSNDSDSSVSLIDGLNIEKNMYATVILNLYNKTLFDEGLSYKAEFLEKKLYHTLKVTISDIYLIDDKGNSYLIRQDPITVDLTNIENSYFTIGNVTVPLGEYINFKFYLQSVEIKGEDYETVLKLNKQVVLGVAEQTMSLLELNKQGVNYNINLVMDFNNKVFKDTDGRWRVYPAIYLINGGENI